ncbi:zinc finger domain-containing protein [Haloarchaeobius sp. TZWSO28]|uniref:zinc finger domain-containing protein n=1 Tax=Haloarchaeobius sp. TZWSO28 TaxID=3446119 RepID=UPI003EBF0280
MCAHAHPSPSGPSRVASRSRIEASKSPNSLDSQPRCPRCGNTVPTVNVSEAVCPDCDTVITERPLSTAPKPRYGEDDTARARAGGRTTYLWADRGVGVGAPVATTTSNGTYSSHAGECPLRKAPWTHRRRSSEIDLDYALGEIRRMGGALDVPQAEREDAARLYRKARAADLIVGRSADGFATACLLASIRRSSQPIPVSESELQFVSRASQQQIRTARGSLEFELSLGIPPMNPRHFVPRFVSQVGASPNIEQEATSLIRAWEQSERGAASGVSPRTLAGAAIHAAYETAENYDGTNRPTLAKLSEVVNVAGSTLSTRKGDLIAVLNG